MTQSYVRRVDKDISLLIQRGTSPQRAADLVGIPLEDYYRRKKRAREIKRESNSRNRPVPSVEPWRCPSCRHMIKTTYCIYCRDRKEISNEKEEKRRIFTEGAS